jgi:uncharacterized membrane protein
MLSKALVAASIAWLTLLGAGWWSRTHAGPGWLTAGVYFTAGRVCHQRPDRSFWTLGAPWPVCGRCAGLYLSAPLGAFAAVATRRRRRAQLPSLVWLAAAAVPTAATFGLELAHLAPMTSLARAIAALPLGAATAFFVTAVAEPALKIAPQVRFPLRIN